MVPLNVYLAGNHTETQLSVRDGETEWEEGVMQVGKRRESIYTYRYTVTNRMTRIKMGREWWEPFSYDVSLTVRDKITRPCPQTTSFRRKESRSGIEPWSFRLPASVSKALPLGQTGSRWYQTMRHVTFVSALYALHCETFWPVFCLLNRVEPS